jgi:hypothetical protein
MKYRSNGMPKISKRYSTITSDKDKIPNLKTERTELPKITRPSSITEEITNKPFAVSVKPT